MLCPLYVAARFPLIECPVLFLLNWLDIDMCFDYTLNFICTFNMIKYY
jgi:hypothetical protein